ncbi:hypothetical protein [Bacillus sp. FJAT-47783]|uniref:hypothetical protein n=1 Tax=Bacillus sp. FJAT-47783 TaxID=2922712 RepID=UPI001FACE725|nr:hypothetical protein [Bacillus sp. FJAT-47783]
MAEEQNKSIPKVELSNFTFSPPGPMGWSFQEYEELLQDPNQFLDSHSKFTNLLQELETAEIIELPTTSRDFVPEPPSHLGNTEEVDTVTLETIEQEMPVGAIEEDVASLQEPTIPLEHEPILTTEEVEVPVLTNETKEEMKEAAELVLAIDTGEEIAEIDQPFPANEAIKEVEKAPQPVRHDGEDEWFVLTGSKSRKSVQKRRTRGNNVIFA